MHVNNTEPHYQRIHMNVFKSFWRRKWFSLIAAVVFLSLFLIIIRQSLSTRVLIIDDAPKDNVPEEVYQDVLRRWYNLTDDKKWFNAKELSAANPTDWERYLKDIRQNWIIWKYNESRSYALENPDINDPSMGQAAVIRDIFNDKENGFFVECGAYDGETRSNTLVLERFLRWTGLLIEADPVNFSKMLQKNRKAFLSPTCLSIQPRPLVASFLMANNIGRLHDPNNSTEEILPNSPDVVHSGVHVKVQCFPLAHYLAALGVQTVDYFSLDIEGNEIEVLETIPFDKLNIKTLSVEHVHNAKGRQYLIDLMEERGYYVHSFVERTDNLANDVIFVKRES